MDQTKLAQKLSWIVAGIIVVLPFHALLTTWIGSNFGHLDAWRIWKELIIFAIAPFALWLAWQDKTLRKWLKTNWLPRLFLLYVILHLQLGLWPLASENVTLNALIYALLINLRFFGFFLVCVIVAAKSDFLKRHWQAIVLLPASLVIIFGLLQRFVLPYDFLKHFGYGPRTIPAYQTIDNKIDYRRIQSTLRGANPLGAYLVLVIPAFLVSLRKKSWLKWLSLLAATAALFYSYSRSAWLGLLISIGLLVYWFLQDKKLKQIMLISGIIGMLVVGGGIIALRNNRGVQNTFFHTDTTSRSPDSSNEDRVDAIKSAARNVLKEPLGRGPGTAGPASFRNNHYPRIAENYFLQIGQEVGWLGIALFITINFLVGKMLWQRRQDSLARLLLATLIGLTFVNMISHAWADDTLSLLFWGLCGIALAPVILNKERKSKNVKTS